MSEFPTLSSEIVVTKTNPDSFRQIVDRSVIKLPLIMCRITFDIKLIKTTMADGTEQIIRPPYLLSEEKCLDRWGMFVLLGNEFVYFLKQRTWDETQYLPGWEDNEGEQTSFYDISITRLPKDTPLHILRTLQPPSERSIRYFYKHRTGFGPAHTPYIYDEEAKVYLSLVGDDPLLREIANGLIRPATT